MSAKFSLVYSFYHIPVIVIFIRVCLLREYLCLVKVARPRVKSLAGSPEVPKFLRALFYAICIITVIVFLHWIRSAVWKVHVSFGPNQLHFLGGRSGDSPRGDSKINCEIKVRTPGS